VQYSTEQVAQLLERPIDYLTFTSSSAVKAFIELIGMPSEVMPRASVICIGPSTTKTAKKLGITVDRMAKPHTVEGMLDQMRSIEREKLKANV
jgi:uroporphyrinogen-III synthase